MNWTNKYHLPEHIIALLPKKYEPKEGRFSVTQVIDSPRIRTLQMKHWDELEGDYSDLLSTVIGISVHEKFAAVATKAVQEDDLQELTEHKMEIEINGVTLVGRLDGYSEAKKCLKDVKTKGVKFTSYPEARKEIENQLNIYAWMVRQQKLPVESLFADIFYRDWKLWEAQKDIPKWAVMKPGRKTAVKLFDSPQEADEGLESGWWVESRPSKNYPKIPYEKLEVPLWSEEKQKTFIIESINYHQNNPMDCPGSCRWSNNIRCKHYCPVVKFCGEMK